MDIPDNLRYLIEAIRGGGKSVFKGGKMSAHAYGEDPLTSTTLKPLEQRRRGYQLYAQEQQAMGEQPASYEEWVTTQQ
jgi:hypothetical protein